jgi:hypothetical protein
LALAAVPALVAEPALPAVPAESACLAEGIFPSFDSLIWVAVSVCFFSALPLIVPGLILAPLIRIAA